MSGIELNYSDITEIFKNNLKIENSVKSIQSIFLNDRFSRKINYKPYFQRNYVWDDEKASYFIESIILGTEIPPLVLFQTKDKNEVIDGRQRYETIERFLNDKLILKEEGLKTLKSLSGERYSSINEDIKEVFENTKLRILQCSVVNEPSLSEEKEDKIKKEIFRRYNSGITSLQKEEIERAEFINDPITEAFKKELNCNIDFFDAVSELFLPKRRMKSQKRDKINILLSRIRTLITLADIPIYSYANSSSKSDVIKRYYYVNVTNSSSKERVENFSKVIKILSIVKKELENQKNELKENILFFECCYWSFSIVIEKENKNIEKDFIDEFVKDICNAQNIEIFWNGILQEERLIENIFNQTGSHYYKSIINRYLFISNYFSLKMNSDFSCYLRNSTAFKTVMGTNVQFNEFNKFKLNKTDPVSITIYDIIKEMEKSRFLVRPNYQRSEVTNQQKASYLLESIMLGIKIPPIFIFKRNDKVKEVIDGQQRLLTLIGFLGKSYVNEDGKKEFSQKDRFRLAKLKILSELNGTSIETIDSKYEDRIWDFPIDVVEIDAEKNPNFSSIDLFLRLNTKPYPVKPNSFEMWNAYVDKEIILEIKEMAKLYEGRLFRPKDPRMKNEELITSLAFLDYKQKKNKIIPTDLVNIYIRNGKINARIKSKESITKFLSDVSNSEDKSFLGSVRSVNDFIKKIKVLAREDFTNLNNLFSHKAKNTNSKTDQNFYFLWMMLNGLTLQKVRESADNLFSIISNKFALIQKVPENYNIYEFVKEITIQIDEK